MFKLARTISAALVLIAIGASTADAAAARFGATSQAIAALTRGTAVAYDSINKVYLVVGSHGVLRGRFVGADGVPIGAPFGIQANPAAFAHFPRVAFSPHADGGAGGFLVTWHEGAPSTHARMVSLGKGGAYGNDTQLTGDVTWWEAGAPVAYSTQSQEFLVAWRRLGGGGVNNDIRAVRVDNTATPKGPVFNVVNDVHYNDNPSIAYNPSSDEFMVVYTGYHDAGNFAYVDSQRVQAGTGALSGAVTRLVQTGGTYITDTTYNPSTNTFLAAWYSLPGGAAFARVLNADGSLNGNIITLSTRYKAYDALGLDYNRRSNTFMYVSHGTTAEDGGIELHSNGTPVDNGFLLTAAGGNGNFYPRVAASTDDPNWLASTANNFTSTMVQLVAGTVSASDPGPSPAPPPAGPTPPAAPQPSPKGNVDYPAAHAAVSGNAFLVSGWAIDQGASSGTGVDFVQVWAFPVGQTAGVFLGTATYGIARSDVAGYVGAQFTNCGYTLIASLAPGAYDVQVFAHSTVTNTFNIVRVVRVNVQAAVSNPKMWIDVPSNNQTTSQNITVAGWAIDLGAATGTGVDTVHVWAYPTSGANPIFVGLSHYGDTRGDIAAYAGHGRFAPSGFRVTGTLPPGEYQLVAFAHSTVTNTFNNVVVIPIQVR